MQVVVELDLFGLIERRERLQHRAVERLEHVEEVLRRAIAEVEQARFSLDGGCARVEHFGQPRTCAPQRRRFGACGRRQIFAERLEDLSDKSFGRPVRQTDLAFRPANAQKLGGRLVLVRREHHTEGGKNRIEIVVAERQVFGVGLLEFDCHAFGFRAGAAVLQQRGHVVGRGDVAPAPRGSERRHAVAGGNIEHFRAGVEIERFAELLTDDLQRRADDGVVAGRPCGLLSRFEGGKIGGAVGTADRVGFGALAVLAIGISFGMARPQGATAMNRNCARAHQKTLTAD